MVVPNMEKNHRQRFVEQQTLIDELSYYDDQMYGVSMFLFRPKNRVDKFFA